MSSEARWLTSNWGEENSWGVTSDGHVSLVASHTFNSSSSTMILGHMQACLLYYYCDKLHVSNLFYCLATNPDIFPQDGYPCKGYTTCIRTVHVDAGRQWSGLNLCLVLVFCNTRFRRCWFKSDRTATEWPHLGWFCTHHMGRFHCRTVSRYQPSMSQRMSICVKYLASKWS